MKKQLGIKTSPILIICRIAVILLFVGGVSCLFLARQEKGAKEQVNSYRYEEALDLALNC